MQISKSGFGTIAPVLWSSHATHLPAMRMFGLTVTNASKEAALDWISGRVFTGERTRIAFLNAHCANVAASDATYREALATTDALLPDGSGIALAARLHRTRLAANLNGTDLVPALCERLAYTGHSVFLLGGRPGVAEDAALKLQADYPGLAIAGSHHGFLTEANEAATIREINASGASVILVAMGVPMQDSWLARVAPQLRPAVSIGVGALFDFLAGKVSRAPQALRSTGLEWTWRLAQEPARMWRRYIVGNPLFVARAVIDASRIDADRLARADQTAKRCFDLLATGCGMLLLAPLLLMVAGLVKLTSAGPAFYRQTRIGQDGVPFSMYKFRSMYIDADARRAALVAGNEHGSAGVTFKIKNDPRITALGRFLRKSSIDELPQLWNVLKGDMSLVGPRPQLPGEVAQYKVSHFGRLAAKPGLTCLWQISGRANIAFEQQCELDMHYLNTRNVLVDLMILLRTVPAVLAARGAY